MFSLCSVCSFPLCASPRCSPQLVSSPVCLPRPFYTLPVSPATAAAISLISLSPLLLRVFTRHVRFSLCLLLCLPASGLRFIFVFAVFLLRVDSQFSTFSQAYNAYSFFILFNFPTVVLFLEDKRFGHMCTLSMSV